MTKQCSKCGNELAPEWVICPICKEEVKSEEDLNVESEQLQIKIDRMENLKEKCNPFNEKYFPPSMLIGIIIYIFTIPFIGPLFGFVIPLILILGCVIGSFITLFLFSTFKLSRMKK